MYLRMYSNENISITLLKSRQPQSTEVRKPLFWVSSLSGDGRAQAGLWGACQGGGL